LQTRNMQKIHIDATPNEQHDASIATHYGETNESYALLCHCR
jgi:hypothetical protein